MKLFTNPSLQQLTEKKLSDARVSLLEAQEALDFYTHTVQMQLARIARLEKSLTDLSNTK